MTLKLRKMKKFYPRRSSKVLRAQRQKLSNFKQNIQSEIGQLLSYLQEGNTAQALAISQKIQNHIINSRSTMEKIAQELGGALPKKLYQFLQSINGLISPDVITQSLYKPDANEIQECNKALEKLQKALHK